MPLYDYRCLTCGEGFEMLQSFSDATLKKCPSRSKGGGPEGCADPGKGKVEKLLSTPAIIFKGQGFYKTDSKKTKTETSPEKTKTEASPKSSPEKTKTEKTKT